MDARLWRWRSASLRRSSGRCRPSEASRSAAVREILFVAGEASGDLHASGVAEELLALGAPFALTGIGGDRLRDAGVALIEHADRLAVMGFAEVLRHLPRHWGLLRDLKGRIRGGRVALVVLIDYPGFNMKLARSAHDAGVPVLYYITPQVWAWGAERASFMLNPG